MTKHAPIASSPIPFVDLDAQRRRLGNRIDEAIARVLAHCQFILGPEVRLLEADLARFCGAREVITCANGTDALALVLMAKGLKAGEAVFCPTFTFAATAEVVAWFGATPVFVDVDRATFNLDAASLAAGIATARQLGLAPAGVVPVDLFGQPADYDAIEPICQRHGLWMLADAAQSFGGLYRGRRIGTIGNAAATSFYPSKPLACYGDGGAVVTDDGELAGVIRSLRDHGAGSERYDHARIGMNSRLDTIQAAVLIEKLKILPDEIEKRAAAAARYAAALAGVVTPPAVLSGCVSAWAQYTVKVPGGRRDALAADLRAQGIPTAIHYPRPLHQQTAYRQFPVAGNGLPAAEALAGEVISLPLHPYLEPAVQDRIVDAVRRALD
jgi:dTDP-4-amino-4,6-dideoxygalactose transaminase